MICYLLLAALSAAVAEAPDSAAPGNFALFLSPMGEPFRTQSDPRQGLQAWFAQADKDASGALSPEEMNGDAARFFAVLNTVADGEIDPDEVTHYENVIAPEIHTLAMRSGGRVSAESGGSSHHGKANEDYDEFGGRVSGPSRSDRAREALTGAGRFSLLNIPEPVSSADTNFNRGVSLAEFQKAATQRFTLIDTNRDGKLDLNELQALLPVGRR